MMPWRHHRHRRWRGHHKHGHAIDLQHLFFRWLVGAVLIATFIAAHFGFFSRDAGLRPSGFWLVLVVSMLVFWFASGHISRHLSRPMGELTHLARAIGEGNYSGRTRLSEHQLREVRILARTLDDMAARVQRQLTDQRELLAAVSHELRSPLARMRVLLELARARGVDEASLAAIDEEVVACDRLIGIMLASSRLDFSTLDLRPLDGEVVARRALQRERLSESLLVRQAGDLGLEGDATLIAQALANLLENAARHGGGATALTVESTNEYVSFSVEDAGNGFGDDSQGDVFESFHRQHSGQTQGLGLGLSLVKRIALSHGGRVWAENRPGGGARVGFSVQRRQGQGKTSPAA